MAKFCWLKKSHFNSSLCHVVPLLHISSLLIASLSTFSFMPLLILSWLVCLLSFPLFLSFLLSLHWFFFLFIHLSIVLSPLSSSLICPPLSLLLYLSSCLISSSQFFSPLFVSCFLLAYFSFLFHVSSRLILSSHLLSSFHNFFIHVNKFVV